MADKKKRTPTGVASGSKAITEKIANVVNGVDRSPPAIHSPTGAKMNSNSQNVTEFRSRIPLPRRLSLNRSRDVGEIENNEKESLAINEAVVNEFEDSNEARVDSIEMGAVEGETNEQAERHNGYEDVNVVEENMPENDDNDDVDDHQYYDDDSDDDDSDDDDYDDDDNHYDDHYDEAESHAGETKQEVDDVVDIERSGNEANRGNDGIQQQQQGFNKFWQLTKKLIKYALIIFMIYQIVKSAIWIESNSSFQTADNQKSDDNHDMLAACIELCCYIFILILSLFIFDTDEEDLKARIFYFLNK